MNGNNVLHRKRGETIGQRIALKMMEKKDNEAYKNTNLEAIER